MSATYALSSSETNDRYEYRFNVGDYDSNHPLVLDPAVIVYTGYIGGVGSEWELPNGITVDNSGNVFVTGRTTSTEATFPVAEGPDLSYNGGYSDAYLAKISADGKSLLYAGFIGGDDLDGGRSIAVDDGGNAYITGYTASIEDSFPVTGGPDLSNNGGRDAFVAKISADGRSLLYAGYIGGNSQDYGMGIAVDTNANVYIVGATDSTEATFPVTEGPDLSYNGSTDAFIAKISEDGESLLYAGFIGGDDQDTGYSIAVDDAGDAYITGLTSSTEATFPVMEGPDLSYNGGDYDAFVVKISADGRSLLYAGYIGGDDIDYGTGIAVDTNANVYIVGDTNSTEATFPVTEGPDLSYNGSTDAFITKISADGRSLLYAGYFGGNGIEGTYGIAVDDAGDAYITGHTSSTEATFPVTEGPDLSYNGGDYDAFVAKISADGRSLLYAGYIGGDDSEISGGIAVDDAGDAYITGFTSSTEATFPVMEGPDLSYNGGQDAFVAKITEGSGETYSISGRVTDANNNLMSGVTISIPSGLNATTDSTGVYTITGVTSGVYELIATKEDYDFWPPKQRVSIPPDSVDQDFTEWACAIDVPMYFQGDPYTPPPTPIPTPTWHNQIYDNYPETATSDTIGRWGCNISSMAMVISYFGRASNPPFETDPGELDTGLKDSDGYNGHLPDYGDVLSYAWDHDVELFLDRFWAYPEQPQDDQRLDQHLCLGNPAILKVRQPNSPSGVHFVVATGKVNLNGQITYTINDPILGQTVLSRTPYNGNYLSTYYYALGIFIRRSMLEISAHSPVHLLIVDPLGRRLGYDPRTDTWWNEIPDAGYETGSIASSDGSTLPEMKNLLIPHPIDGQYNVQVIGYDTGSYEVIIHKNDLWGNITQESFLGEAQDNSVDNFTIEFTINEIYLPIIIHDN